MYFSNQIGGLDYYGDPRFGLALVCVLGLLMLSPIHFPKVPLITFKSSPSNSILLLILIACTLSLFIWKGIALLPICLGYIVMNTLVWMFKTKPKNV